MISSRKRVVSCLTAGTTVSACVPRLPTSSAFSVCCYSCVMHFYVAKFTFGCREKETKRNHLPFDKKVGCKLSDHFSCWVYQMEWHVFNILCEILTPQIERVCIPLGNRSRKANTSHYRINTKTRLSIVVYLFCWYQSLWYIMQEHNWCQCIKVTREGLAHTTPVTKCDTSFQFTRSRKRDYSRIWEDEWCGKVSVDVSTIRWLFRLS